MGQRLVDKAREGTREIQRPDQPGGDLGVLVVR